MESSVVAAAASDLAPPLAFMTHLSPHVYFYQPDPRDDNDDRDRQPPHPKMVLIASWMDARDAHIAKYVIQYRVLYPGAQILLVKCDLRHMMGRRDETADPIAVAAPVLRDVFPPGSAASSGDPELLVHVFSNGGSATLQRLRTAYEEKKQLPRHCLVFDSAPGRFSYGGSVTVLAGAFAGALSLSPATTAWIRLPMRFAVGLLARLVCGWLWVARAVLRRPDGLAATGQSHNNSRNNEARRAYLYSSGDAVVDWRHVEAHAEEARTAGFAVVRKENFGRGSPHVAHARTDGERYWRAVRETWRGDGR